MWSSTNDSKERLAVTTTITRDKETAENCENNVEAQQEEENRTDTEPIWQVTEQHIAQNEEDEGRGEENAELLMNY